MKKKLLLIIFAIAVTLTCACTHEPEPKELFALPLTLNASLLPNGSEFKAVIYPDKCDVSFEGSHSLSGTLLHLTDEKNTAEIEGYFEREVKKGTFPAQEALFKAVRLLANCNQNGEKSENRTKYSIDEMTIMVYYDNDTEKVTHIETEENGRRFLFAVSSLTVNEAQSIGAG